MKALCISASNILHSKENSVFPIQKYDWNLLTQKLRDYAEIVLREVS